MKRSSGKEKKQKIDKKPAMDDKTLDTLDRDRQMSGWWADNVKKEDSGILAARAIGPVRRTMMPGGKETSASSVHAPARSSTSKLRMPSFDGFWRFDLERQVGSTTGAVGILLIRETQSEHPGKL